MASNLLQNQYLSFDDVLSLDETFLGDISLIFLVNVTSGMILGQVISDKSKTADLTSDDLIELIDDLIYEKKRGGYPCFQVLHGDKSPLYSCKSFINLLSEYNIRFSYSVGGSFQNQISETYNNVVKRHVCMIILGEFSRSEIRALNNSLPKELAQKRRSAKANSKEFRKKFFKLEYVKNRLFTVIPEAIELSNESKHTLFDPSSRREIEKIIRDAKRPSARSRELRLATRGTDAGNEFVSEVVEARNRAIQNKEGIYVPSKPIIIPEVLPGDENQTPESFIEQLRQANQESNLEVLNTIVKAVEILGSQSQAQTESLKADNIELRAKINYLTEQAKIAADEKETARLRKEKRARANRDRRRDAIQDVHFYAALELAKHPNKYKEARNRCALTLLFITGLRSSELRFITVKLVKELFQNGTMGVDRCKRGVRNKPATLTKTGRKTLSTYHEDFETVFRHKIGDDSYFFTAIGGNKPLARETIQRDLNTILSQLKTQFPGLYFRTHSFRSGYITRLWRNGFDINKIRQAIGHKSIIVTQGYIEDMDEAELQKEISSVEEDS